MERRSRWAGARTLSLLLGVAVALWTSLGPAGGAQKATFYIRETNSAILTAGGSAQPADQLMTTAPTAADTSTIVNSNHDTQARNYLFQAGATNSNNLTGGNIFPTGPATVANPDGWIYDTAQTSDQIAAGTWDFYITIRAAPAAGKTCGGTVYARLSRVTVSGGTLSTQTVITTTTTSSNGWFAISDALSTSATTTFTLTPTGNPGTNSPTVADVTFGSGERLYVEFGISESSTCGSGGSWTFAEGQNPDDPTFYNRVVTSLYTKLGATAVTLAFFQVEERGTQVVARWATSTEAENLGFRLYAVDERGRRWRLNDRLIPSQVISSPSPQEYWFVARRPLQRKGQPFPGKGQRYWLEDLDLDGKSTWHGPFLLGQSYGSPDRPKESDWGNGLNGLFSPLTPGAPHPFNLASSSPSVEGLSLALALGQGPALGRRAEADAPLELTKPSAAAPSGAGAGAGARLSDTPFHLGIRKGGVYRLTYEYLASQGVDFAGARPQDLALTNRGQAVPIYVSATGRTFGPGHYIQFEATELHTLYTGENIYTLSADGSKAVRLGTDQIAVPNRPYIMSDLRLEENRIYWPGAANGSDYWFWQWLYTDKTTPGTATISFNLDGLYSGSQGMPDAAVQIGLYGLSKGPHHAKASLNGRFIGEVRWEGQSKALIQASLPQGLVLGAGNALALTLPGDIAAAYDAVYLDYLAVTYPKVPGPPPLYHAVASVRSAKPNTGWAQPGPVDYLIVSHPAFLGEVAPLAEARQAGGLRVRVVDVTDAYNEFTYGIFDPQAIKSLIAHAQKSWGTKFVLLVGGDTYDYHNYLGLGSISYLPSLYARDKFFGVAPSDNLYADTNGDGAPDVAMGRFPARSRDQVRAMVAKTLAFPASVQAYRGRAVFVADDDLWAFNQLSDSLISLLPPGFQVTKAYVSEVGAAAARQTLLNALTAGSFVANYVGHSSPNRWAKENILATADAASLGNVGKPAIVLQWGCMTNYYVDPRLEGIAHALMAAPDRGAVAAIGAINFTEPPNQGRLAEKLFRRLFNEGLPLGVALQRAKVDLLREVPAAQDVVDGWELFGDPALGL